MSAAVLHSRPVTPHRTPTPMGRKGTPAPSAPPCAILPLPGSNNSFVKGIPGLTPITVEGTILIPPSQTLITSVTVCFHGVTHIAIQKRKLNKDVYIYDKDSIVHINKVAVLVDSPSSDQPVDSSSVATSSVMQPIRAPTTPVRIPFKFSISARRAAKLPASANANKGPDSVASTVYYIEATVVEEEISSTQQLAAAFLTTGTTAKPSHSTYRTTQVPFHFYTYNPLYYPQLLLRESSAHTESLKDWYSLDIDKTVLASGDTIRFKFRLFEDIGFVIVRLVEYQSLFPRKVASEKCAFHGTTICDWEMNGRDLRSVEEFEFQLPSISKPRLEPTKLVTHVGPLPRRIPKQKRDRDLDGPLSPKTPTAPIPVDESDEDDDERHKDLDPLDVSEYLGIAPSTKVYHSKDMVMHISHAITIFVDDGTDPQQSAYRYHTIPISITSPSRGQWESMLDMYKDEAMDAVARREAHSGSDTSGDEWWYPPETKDERFAEDDTAQAAITQRSRHVRNISVALSSISATDLPPYESDVPPYDVATMAAPVAKTTDAKEPEAQKGKFGFLKFWGK